MKTTSRVPLWHLLLIVGLGVLAYANTFHAPFELDDLESIADNPILQSLANFLPGGEGYHFHPRRWVGYVTFALNYSAGGLSLPGFHAVNVAVHLGAALLVYALVRVTFRTPKLAGSRLAPRAGTAALLAALFFVLHPVQTQAVTYVVQRLTSLATLLYLSALGLYAAGRVRQEETPGSGAAALLLVASAVPAVLAMQTKEIALTLPLAAVLYEVSFFRGPWKPRLLGLLPLLLTLPLLPCQTLLGPGAPPAAAAAQNAGVAHLEIPWLHYLFTQFRVVVTYLRLLLLPVGQNVDYDYPVSTSLASAPVLASLLLLVALLAAGALLHRRSSRSDGGAGPLSRDPALRLVSFGVFWFFLTLSVESGLLSLADVIFEHRLYLPAVGAAAAVAVGVLLASEATATLFRGRLPLWVAGASLAALAVATVQRNHVWGSNVGLWEDAVRKSPAKERPWYNLGTYLTDGGQPARAVPALAQALAINPKNAGAWHNLGRALVMLGQPEQGVRAMQRALALAPDLDNAAVNLSAALLRLHRAPEAVPLLERVRARDPNWPEARMNLGLAYAGSGNFEAARGELAFLQQAAPDLAANLAYALQRAAAGPVAP